MILAAALLAGVAVALIPRPNLQLQGPPRLWAVPIRPIAVAVGLYVVVGGAWGMLGGIAAAAVVARRRSGSLSTAPAWGGDAPIVVGLIAAAIRAGVPASLAVEAAAAVVDPAQMRGLSRVVERWRYGLSALDIELDRSSRLLARAIEQSQDSGAAPTAVLEHAADELAAEIATRAQERARQVGVRAAIPLGVCLLPAFLCLGVVPLVASLMSGLAG